MTDLDIFRDEFLPAAEKHKRVSMDSWSKSAPADYARWVTYRDALVRGEQPQAPLMTTEYGKMLVAAGKLVTFSASPPPPPPPTGEILWRGDFETGDTSQYASVHQAQPGRVSVVQSPRRQGTYAGRFEVRPGDFLWSGERAEVLLSQQTTDGFEGHEAYWGWSTYFDPSFVPVPNQAWNIFTQFHNTGSLGQANVMFYARETMIGMAICNGDVAHPTRRDWTLISNRVNGRWYGFVFFVRWSSDPAQGRIQCWVDGNVVVPLTTIQTLYPGQGSYFKQGYYRQSYTNTAIVYHDNTRRGSTFEVM